jgi:hypothetical protein
MKEKEKESKPQQPQTNTDRKAGPENTSTETPPAKNEEAKKEDDTSGYVILESGLGIDE